jgi:hypothetical protein
MIRKLLLASTAAMMLMALQSVAYADAVTLVQGQSITFTYQSTQFAGSSAQATFTLQGNQLIVQYTNTSTNGTFLSGVGFDTTPNLNVTNASFSNSNWQFDTNGGGLGGFEMVVSGNGNHGRLAGGQSGTAVLTLSSVPPSLVIDLTRVHLTSLPNGDSEKPVGAVPEPTTMLLLGTGLAGIAARIRKRRKQVRE